MNYPLAMIIFAAGFLAGVVLVYILTRSVVGILELADHEGDTYIFLKLEKDLPEFRRKQMVRLRVENTSYYEN